TCPSCGAPLPALEEAPAPAALASGGSANADGAAAEVVAVEVVEVLVADPATLTGMEGGSMDGMPSGMPASGEMGALSDQPAAGEPIDVVMVEAVAFEAVPVAASEEALSSVMQPLEPVIPTTAPLAQPAPTAPSSMPPTLPPAAQLPTQTGATKS